MTSEVAALAAEKAFNYLKAPIRRITTGNCPAPVSQPLERAFYPNANTIIQAVFALLGRPGGEVFHIDRVDNFKGPY